MTEVTVEVDQPWTVTDVSCAAGDTLNIRASGQAWFETENTNSGPEGMLAGEHSDSAVTLAAHPLQLIGSLDTVDELFNVGLATTYECPVGGRLWLGVNDNTPEGNTGNFLAAVTHRPSG